MAKVELTTKRVQIDKANTTMFIVIAVAVFITIFSLVSLRALVQRYSYQSKVITSREKARDQLRANVEASKQLTESYTTFVSSQENIIGGSSSGSGPRDGDNGRIILDALPSRYDFPALATSIEKLANEQAVKLTAISGTDDEVNQAQNKTQVSPTPIEVPFELTAEGGYDSIINLVGVFERSIRPFVFDQTVLTAADSGQVSVTLKARTFYQPEKSLELKSEVVK